ncbi:hypothetical protein EMIT0P43_80038 [Pseudomonas jessenii]
MSVLPKTKASSSLVGLESPNALSELDEVVDINAFARGTLFNNAFDLARRAFPISVHCL